MQTARVTTQSLSYLQNTSKATFKQTMKSGLNFSTSATREQLKFEGVMAAVYAPLSEDGLKLAPEHIPKYSKYLASNGIKGVLVCGTNGEGPSLTVSERIGITEAWVQAARADNLHIQVQVGGTNIQDAQALAKHAECCGADSILTLPDLYYKPSSVSALVQYLKKIASAAPSKPILFYHNPSQTGLNLNVVELLKQGEQEIPTFSGIKYSNGDLIVGGASVAVNPERFTIYLGSAEIMSAAYVLGFRAFTIAAGNMFPTLCVEIEQALQSGRTEEATRKQTELNKRLKTITKYGNRIACLKAATEIISGVPLGPPRFPLPPLDSKSKESLRKDLQNF